MSEHINAKELPLSKVFSSDYEFHIPSYQRPYAWTTEHCLNLFNDLKDFYQAVEKDKNGQAKEIYFLGSIVLIETETNNEFDVVDGQQRLTSLTILISALIQAFDDSKNKNEYIDYIKQPEARSRGLSEKMRLFLREKDNDFFCKNIQNCDFSALKKNDIKLNNDSKKRIKENALLFLNEIKSTFKTETDLEKFGMFLMSNCYLVVVSTKNVDSAFRIFSVMNSRGLNLLPTDILKSEIIGKIQDDKQTKYTNLWEEKEELLSREGFAELFSHIRMIYTGIKPVKTLKEEFTESVLKKGFFKSSEDLIDRLIVPSADAFEEITNQSYKSTCEKENKKLDMDINDYLQWLGRIDVSDWKPVAISFHTRHRNEPEYLKWFYQKLERLTAFLFISSKTAQERISRFKEVINEIKKEKDSFKKKLKKIELTDNEKNEMLSVLNSNIYSELTWLRCKYIVLRLDSFVSDKAAIYNQKIISIEHVLPQTMSKEWQKNWKKTEHEKWLNKIANLVLLSRRKNSQAQNYSFDVKKEKYFKTDNTSSFALTSQVLNEDEWTPKIVSKRQKELIKIFKNKWELNND